MLHHVLSLRPSVLEEQTVSFFILEMYMFIIHVVPIIIMSLSSESL
jgi:hypothetical protein